MRDNYLTEEELYKLLTQNPRIEKSVALSFIKSYGNGRAIAALSETSKGHGNTMIQGLDEAEWEARFESINHSLNQLLHTLAEACQ
jgi:hypothetical protein